MSGVITNANSEVPSDDSDEEGPIDIVPEAMLEWHNGKLEPIPVQYMDIFTGEAIPNDSQFPEEIGQYPEAIPRMQQHLQAGHEGHTWF